MLPKCGRPSSTGLSVLAWPLALAWLAACGGGCVVPQSQNVNGTTSDVKESLTERNYYLYLPQGYTRTKKYPLIVSIHGMKPFDNARPQLMTWKKLCDENGWIAMAPQLRSPDMFNQFPFRRVDSAILDDEALIVSSVREVMSKHSVDTRNVMVTGWSSGGYLIHYVGARHPELFTVIAPQGANFSEDIMPEYVTEAARQTPVYIYHGGLDLPMVVKDCNAAARWYQRHGYRCVQMDEAPGGHERHPELAARFFLNQMHGTNPSAVAAVRAAEPTKMAVLAQPWLTSGVSSVAVGRAGAESLAARPTVSGASVASAAGSARESYPAAYAGGGSPSYGSAGPSYGSAGPSYGGESAPANNGGRVAVTPPAGRAAESSPYSWDRIGPRTPASTTPVPVPRQIQADRFQAPSTVIAKPEPPAPRTIAGDMARAAALGVPQPGLASTIPIAPARISPTAPTPPGTAVAAAPPAAPTPPRNVTGVVADRLADPTPPPAAPVPMPVGMAASVKQPLPDRAGSPRGNAPIADPGRADQPPTPPAAAVVPTLNVPAPKTLAPAPMPTVASGLPPPTLGRNPLRTMDPAAPAGRRITPIGSPQPVASGNGVNVKIIPSAQRGYAPMTVEFRAEVTGVNSPIVRYRWKLEETMFSTLNFGVLTFQQAGRYPIDLTVTDAAGNTHRNRMVITVAGT